MPSYSSLLQIRLQAKKPAEKKPAAPAAEKKPAPIPAAPPATPKPAPKPAAAADTAAKEATRTPPVAAPPAGVKT